MKLQQRRTATEESPWDGRFRKLLVRKTSKTIATMLESQEKKKGNVSRKAGEFNKDGLQQKNRLGTVSSINHTGVGGGEDLNQFYSREISLLILMQLQNTNICLSAWGLKHHSETYTIKKNCDETKQKAQLRSFFCFCSIWLYTVSKSIWFGVPG